MKTIQLLYTAVFSIALLTLGTSLILGPTSSVGEVFGGILLAGCGGCLAFGFGTNLIIKILKE